jgi:hypothetical protein
MLYCFSDVLAWNPKELNSSSFVAFAYDMMLLYLLGIQNN